MIRSYDKKYLKIALPAALEGLFMILLASADLIMVGTLGAVSIAAVSIFLQPRLIILCFTRSLASSVTLLVSRDAGRNDRTNASDILKKSIFIGAIVLLFIHSIFYLFLEDIFYLMGAKTEYMAEALAHGNIALLSVFISSFTLFFQAVRQTARKEKMYKIADEIRDRLDAAGIVIEDTPTGARWKRRGV